MPTNDTSGRLGAIVVTADGGSNLMKRFYGWNADQIGDISTCYLDAGTPIAESFIYDSRGRLQKAQQANFANAGGAYSLREYSYDRRGNQLSTVVDDAGTGNAMIYAYSGHPAAPDQLYSVRHPTYEYSFFDYTHDGQMGRKFGPYDSSGNHNTVWTFDWGESTSIYGTPAGFGGESVYRAMGFGKPGANITYTSYYYDANRRRIAKDVATGAREFYHWSPARELLDDVGYPESCQLFPPRFCRAVDDYVWLGGRPVLQIRSSAIDTTGQEQYYPAADGTGLCNRWGQGAECDAYFIVADQVGRPVLMLNHAMLVSGTGEYEPFGALNRVHMFRESPHPYTTTTDYTFPNVGRPSVGGMKVDVRAHLPMVDLANNGSYVRLEDVDGGALTNEPSVTGPQNADRWTPWVQQPSGRQPQLKFRAVAPNVSWPQVAPSGFLMTEFEFRRYQTTYPLFTRLRGAGQYWDSESDMFENHNRYYDSATGRYLSPEPLLQDPRWVRRMAKRGMSVPTYAYAYNNPVMYIDPTGLNGEAALGRLLLGLVGLGRFSGFLPSGGILPVESATLGDGTISGNVQGKAQQSCPFGCGPGGQVFLPPLPNAGAGTGTGTGAGTRAMVCAMSGATPKSCDQHYDACMDAHEANGWPPVYNCVECTRQCRGSGGQWPTIKESSGDRYLCDYENPWTTPSGN
jgi:RHS repeat-associated protein